MKTIWLAVYILTADGWHLGDQLDGWAPRRQPDMATCMDRKEFANRQIPPDGIKQWGWVCREGPIREHERLEAPKVVDRLIILGLMRLYRPFTM